MDKVDIVTQNRVKKAVAVVRWVYSQPAESPGTTILRQDIIEAMRGMANLKVESNEAAGTFWARVATLAGVSRLSSATVDVVIMLLDLLDEVRSK